jgi:hypothetical protein
LVNLEHLHLSDLPLGEVPGSFPSQLAKLTCLDVGSYGGRYAAFPNFNFQDPNLKKRSPKNASHEDCNFEDLNLRLDAKWQHLSSLTALQQMSIRSPDVAAEHLPNMQHLTQLTSIKLQSQGLIFSTSSISGWTSLSALKSLSLSGCLLQAEALSCLTQLQALSLVSVKSGRPIQWHHDGAASVAAEVLAAVSHLSLLTRLHFNAAYTGRNTPVAVAASDFTALAASTDLCSLVLRIDNREAPHGCDIFRSDGDAAIEHPHLRLINLQGVHLNAPQLERLCWCCPAVDSLTMTCQDPSPIALVPLLQLFALTRLEVRVMDDAAAAASVGVVAQLTQLKRLRLRVSDVARASVLQLTALTALEGLQLDLCRMPYAPCRRMWHIHLHNRVRRPVWCGVM